MNGLRAAIPLAICFLCRVLLAQAVPLQIVGKSQASTPSDHLDGARVNS
jgi:hypothetical protein